MNNDLFEEFRSAYVKYLTLDKQASVGETERVAKVWMDAYNAAYEATKLNSQMRNKLRQIIQECDIAHPKK